LLRKEKDFLSNRRKRDDKTASSTSFVICKKCLGSFKPCSFYRQSKKCRKDIEEEHEDMPENYKKRVISIQFISIVLKLSSATRKL